MNQTLEMKPLTVVLHGPTKKIEHSAMQAIKKSASLALITAMFWLGALVAALARIPVKQVMANYPYDVLVILIVMELFTNLIAETGIMQLLAVRIADLSKGKKRLCLVLFGGMMFIVSSCLNNITAVMIILPVVFVLLNALEVDQKYICQFFAVILALSNTGGAASPIGDFPAIVIMTSGITSFLGYLVRAFPLFAVTSAVLLIFWMRHVEKENDDGAVRALAVSNLKSQYKNICVRFDVLKWLGIIFAGMFLAWSMVPQNICPPEIIAVLGYTAAMLVCALKDIRINQTSDLKSVLTIASFLFFAQVIRQTGILEGIAASLQSNIADPKLLVLAIMLITSLAAGVFSAGPAAAAMMPVIVQLCNGPLHAQADWIAVAYAASICAGSSMFMWSATAGFVLSGKVDDTKLKIEGKNVVWNSGHYLKYGICNYGIQLGIALLSIVLII